MSADESDSHLKKINKKANIFFRKHSIFLGVVLISALLLGLVVVSGKKITSLSSRDFYSSNASEEKIPSNKNTFISSARNFLSDFSEMSFLQNDSLVGVSSPVMITSKVLGSIGIGIGIETRQEIIKYKVKADDTLSSLAAKFNISLETILWANDIKKSIIKIGQEITILPVSGVLYTVKKNDTLGAIAEQHKAEIKDIIAFNGISEEGNVFIGDPLIIPGGQMPKKVSQIAQTPVANSYFIFPCEGRISQGLHYYNAIDVANNCGKPVVAASGGIVQMAGWIKIGGKRVTILHSNGVATYYGHLSTILVGPGQNVSTGEVIGYIGNTGYTLGATGCHLHFAVIGARNFLANYSVGNYIRWKK